jgi:iron complex outermembrane receptor protein
LAFGITYADPYLTDSQPGADPSNGFGFSGDRVPFVAKWNLTSQAEYSVPLAGSWEGYGRAPATYRSGSFPTFNSYSPFYHPVQSYFIADAALGVRHGPWTSEFFVRNLTDKVAELNVRVTTDGYQVSTIRPRMFGVTLTRTF